MLILSNHGIILAPYPHIYDPTVQQLRAAESWCAIAMPLAVGQAKCLSVMYRIQMLLKMSGDQVLGCSGAGLVRHNYVAWRMIKCMVMMSDRTEGKRSM